MKNLNERLRDCEHSGYASVTAEALDRILVLEETVRIFAAANSWTAFGDCRAYSEKAIMRPNELDLLAQIVLPKKDKE
jgi:hypothetical protein|tara:strand:+ start:5628 stop:5861 length:234 start_codon:yes stop_codon:yes gene_type:complete